jgi:hypothetical protein
VQNIYKSIVEGSRDRCRGGDWGKDGAGQEGNGGRQLVGEEMNGARTRSNR